MSRSVRAHLFIGWIYVGPNDDISVGGGRGHEFVQKIPVLDAHYANEMLSKLDQMVVGASALDRIAIANSPDPRMKSYFSEVQRRFLYGFRIVCAVLCRALCTSRMLKNSEIL
jgi:hypothetical protein